MAQEKMTAVMLVATLKPSPEVSNTEVLCEVLGEHLATHGVKNEIIRLVDYKILPGLKRNMGRGDQWPKIIPKLLAADMIIFATPIWWGIASSLMQQAIERLDTENDTLLETGTSPFANKAGGIVITGAEDGAQHVIGNLLNFMSWNGLTIPPAPSLSWLGDPGGTTKIAIKKKFNSGYTKTMAETMARNLVHVVRVLRNDPYKDKRELRKDISVKAVGLRHK